MVSVLAIRHKAPGFEAMDFKGDKNLRHVFLRRGSKAEGPMT
jgi:hypothetical protein